MALYHGWSQIAFSKQLKQHITPVHIGKHPLIAVRREGESVRVFDAACPHRGAHLGHGGTFDANTIICPFHGRRVALGCTGSSRYEIREYPVVEASGCVFARTSERYDHGFADYVQELARTHYLMPGFTLPIDVAPECVIENIFDTDHFHAVHGLSRPPKLAQRTGDHGELIIEGIFETPAGNQWQEEQDGGATAHTRFYARVFSPTLAAAELGEPGQAQVVITAATATPEGTSDVRVSVAMPPTPRGTAPTLTSTLALLRDSETAFEQDRPIWENLCAGAPSNLDSSDHLIVAYHEFCDRMRDRGQ